MNVHNPKVVVGAVFGVGLVLGAGGTWAYLRLKRRSLLRALAVVAKDPSLDPGNRDMEVILRELQLTWNLPGDGKWTAQTEALIARLTRELERKQARPAKEVASNPQVDEGEPPDEAGPVDPFAELEPDEDWEVVYQGRIEDALRQAILEPDVVSFDQAVIYVLMAIFPTRGRFHDNPAMGTWKERARERARSDLATRLGHTEAEARAVLNARTVGTTAASQGLGLGAVVRAMGEHAFPTEDWSRGFRPWQRLFAERAASELQGRTA